MNGQQYSGGDVLYTYQPAAAVSYVSPSTVLAEGGTPVTVHGAHFSSASEAVGQLLCRMGTTVRRARWASANVLVCNTTRAAGGQLGVEVSNNGREYTADGVRVEVVAVRVVATYRNGYVCIKHVNITGWVTNGDAEAVDAAALLLLASAGVADTTTTFFLKQSCSFIYGAMHNYGAGIPVYGAGIGVIFRPGRVSRIFCGFGSDMGGRGECFPVTATCRPGCVSQATDPWCAMRRRPNAIATTQGAECGGAPWRLCSGALASV